MLVLSRKPEQKIHIGDSVTITVLAIRGSVVRLGIEAPADVRILRGELEPKDTSGEDKGTGLLQTARATASAIGDERLDGDSDDEQHVAPLRNRLRKLLCLSLAVAQ